MRMNPVTCVYFPCLAVGCAIKSTTEQGREGWFQTSNSAEMKQSILVVDDTPAILELLSNILIEQGYHVRVARSGRMAMKAIEKSPPDLILMDVNMPEMDGYETSRKIKQDDRFRDIPVLFLSALNSTDDILGGFDAGGVDYITKPFRAEEVEARISTHLKIRLLQQQLKEHNENLEKLVAERTRSLKAAHERLQLVDRIKGEFLVLLSHEFRTPLNGLLGFSEVAFMLDADSEETKEMQEQFNQCRDRILNLLDDALLIHKLDLQADDFGLSDCPFGEIWDAAMGANPEFAEQLQVAEIPFVIRQQLLLCEEELLIKALVTLGTVAVLLAGGNLPVPVRIEFAGGAINIRFRMQVTDMPEEVCRTFFELSSTARPVTRAESLSLAPVAAQSILSICGGKAELIPEDTDSTTLKIAIAVRSET
jgi:two-component system sensor histidine kinase/response regulator